MPRFRMLPGHEARGLARKNSKTLAIVGAGHMAEGTLATCDTVFAFDKVRVWSRSQSTLDEFVKIQARKYRFPIHPSRELAEVVRGADVVVTVTPAREPLVKDEWIAPGTHIAGLGADKGGDQELDPRILQRPRIFVDDIRQCRTDGEISVPASRTSPAKSAKSSPARSRAAAPTMTLPCLIPPASRCRIRRRFRSNTSARSLPASASRRR